MTSVATGRFDAAVGSLAPISLAQLEAGSALLTRTDRKYIVDDELATRLVRDLGDRLAVLDIDGRRSFGYTSTYFDTDELALHRAAATGRRHRFKVRTRTYDDVGVVMLEVKSKDGRGRTVKSRLERPIELAGCLDDVAQAFVAATTGATDLVADLRPSLTTRYRRTTLVDASGDARATIDHDLVCATPDGRSLVLDGVIVETKSGLTPSRFDRWTWQQGVRPTRVSKYCTALAILHPGLPDNAWHRTIARHFRPVA